MIWFIWTLQRSLVTELEMIAGRNWVQERAQFLFNLLWYLLELWKDKGDVIRSPSLMSCWHFVSRF